MLLSLLFQIRSPSGYTFLREQNILLLPCVDTLKRHLMAVKIGYSFDEKFFKILKKKFMKSLSVNSKNLTYLGLNYLGYDVDNKAELANHALMLMIQSLAESLHQPIAVFASKGPIKAILLSENAGVEVIGKRWCIDKSNNVG
ncbi:uncharacterized protein LOC113560214 [Rhopalosiphum maidis]|uniref:uncharacterized protein LOC113560214 n=1 Tax=Rhopalosiphum maidis TaxID=43146 RepID=UPI000EFE23AB|nr:uncharacterized protein LOC113560214 [Rhopalosiphum maidis]